MRCHGNGEKEKAINLYKKFLDSGGKDKRVYTNLAALLRTEGSSEEALKIISNGLKEMGKDSPIMLNTLGNCLRDLNRNCEAISAYRKAIKGNRGYFDPQISIVGALHDMGLKQLSDLCLINLFKFYGLSQKTILNQIILREVENANSENRRINESLDVLIEHADITSNNDNDEKLPVNWFLLSQLCIARADRRFKILSKSVLLTEKKLLSSNKKA